MQLIRPFDPWKNSACTCPKKYSLSPYTGCGHGCLYCYASSYIPNFFNVRQKKDYFKRLLQELKKLPKNALLAIANSSDPYTPQEKEIELMPQTLEIISNYDLRLMIITKSSLITRDILQLKKIKKLVISFSVTTLDNKLAKRLEPAAPGPQVRLKAIEALSQHFPVVCRFDPLIYPLNTKEIKKMVSTLKAKGIKQIITSTYKAKPDNFKRMLRAFPEHTSLWQELYLDKGESRNNYTYLEKTLRKRLIEEVREAALKEKLAFSSCREGFKKDNTKACDGSSFF